jgi:hypothetical protein
MIVTRESLHLEADGVSMGEGAEDALATPHQPSAAADARRVYPRR